MVLTKQERERKIMRKWDEKFYVLDFFLPDLNMDVEVDGYHHIRTERMKNRDHEMMLKLRSIGITTRRYQNNEIEKNIDLVIENIFRFENILKKK